MGGFGSGLIHPVLERPHAIYPIKTRISYGDGMHTQTPTLG